MDHSHGGSSGFLWWSPPSCFCVMISVVGKWLILLTFLCLQQMSVVTQNFTTKSVLQLVDGDKCFLPCKIYNCAANGGINLNAFSSSLSSWLCKDTQLARNKKGNSFLLLSTPLLADPSNGAHKK